MNEQLESRLRHGTRSVDDVDLGPTQRILVRVGDRLHRRDRHRRRVLVASTATLVVATVVGVAALVSRPEGSAGPVGRTAPSAASGSAPSSVVENLPSTVTGSSTAPEPTAQPTTMSQPSTTASEPSRWRPIAPHPNGVGWDLSSVWMGAEAFVLGPHADAYDPTTDTWRALAPFPREWSDVDVGSCGIAAGTCRGEGIGESADGYGFVDSIVVWTGDEVLVMGGDLPAADQGDTSDCGADCRPGLVKSAAFAYVPGDDRWQLLISPPWFVNARSPHVWTGDELLVWPWDLDSTPDPPYAYDPRTNTWRQLPDAPIAPRQNAASVWTGQEWIVWGGGSDDGEYADGAAFDPATNTWRILADAPIGPRKTSAVWTGTEMILMAGSQGGGTGVCCGNSALSDGAAYDPATDTWRTLAGTVGHPGFEPLWADGLLFMFAKGGVIVYDPATQGYVDVCCDGLAGSTQVWTGTEVISFGSYTDDRGGGIFLPPRDD